LEERNEQLRSKKYEMNLMNEEIKEQRGKWLFDIHHRKLIHFQSFYSIWSKWDSLLICLKTRCLFRDKKFYQKTIEEDFEFYQWFCTKLWENDQIYYIRHDESYHKTGASKGKIQYQIIVIPCAFLVPWIENDMINVFINDIEFKAERIKKLPEMLG
jgi:hypothetical protein